MPAWDSEALCFAANMTDFAVWVEKNKALWTRVYDEVIVPDLEDEWKSRKCTRPTLGIAH